MVLQQQSKYNLTKVISDNFRTDIVRRPFEEAGIPLEVIKNPTAIHGLLAPRIDTMFAKKQITFGDNPLMRWFTNNVAVKMQPDGSKKYIKKMKLDVKLMVSMPCYTRFIVQMRY